jgi:hypothetical protein
MNQLTTNPRGPTRAEVERWCLLTAIAGGCSRADLVARLGLSPLLAGAIRLAVLDVSRSGFVAELEDRFSVTESGDAWRREFATQNNIE